MAQPAGSTNGGIIGVSNKTSFGKNKVTSGTASGPATLTTQAGTRFIDALVVAGGGGGGNTAGGSAGGGGAGGYRTFSNLSTCGSTPYAYGVGAGGAANTSGTDTT